MSIRKHSKAFNVPATGLLALLLAGGARAQDVAIAWQVTGEKIGVGYLPKLTSDGMANVAAIAGTGTGLSAFRSQIGSYSTGAVSWAGSSDYLFSPPQITPQVGRAPSIALAYDAVNNHDNAIEVHQGGQDNQGSLWFQLGSSFPSSAKIDWSVARRYDTGYNATVATDLNGPSKITTTVVEVHQARPDQSALSYHVGILTLGASPSISWGPAIEIHSGMTQGYAPTVSVANKLAVLVAQGPRGALWYAIGVVDTDTSIIDWTDPIPYGAGGYNPAISVYGNGTDDDTGSGRVVVEAHQVNSGPGPLSYRTGFLKNGADGSSPTSITWNSNSDTAYATGCYPSVALASSGDTAAGLRVTETHETASVHSEGCAAATTLESSFGYLASK